MSGKKLLYGCLAIGLAIAPAGCSDSELSSPSPVGKDTDTGIKKVKDPVTFTFFMAQRPGKDVNTNETIIGKKLEEQTGVNFKMEHIVGDINMKIGVMNASGDYPDVIVPDVAIDKVKNADGFIPLNELLDKHAPNLKKLYARYWERMKAKDGNIYFIPFSATQGFIPSPDITAGAFWMQRRVLKEFGYPKIKTMDEYFDLIKKYKEKHQNEDLIGFETLTYDWRFHALANPAVHMAGYPNEAQSLIDMKTHQAKNVGPTDFTKRWLKKLNEINNQGLFDKESLVANYDQYLAKLTSGRVLGYFDYAWEAAPAHDNLKQAGDDDKRYMPLPIVFDKEVKDQYVEPPAFVNNRGIGISVSAKDPVRIIEYFDALSREENQILSYWGVKGETYEVDDKGRFYRTDEQIQKTSEQEFQQKFGLWYYNYGWPGGGGVLSDGNAWSPGDQPEVVSKKYTEGDKAILKAYGASVFSDLFSKPDERPWFPMWSVSWEQGSKEQIFMQKRADVQKKNYPKMILAASPEQFETLWNEYMNEFNKLDWKIHEESITRIVNERINNKWQQ
ncbi:ABC transporter substrate-binding protein [Paenibacillus agricola]|uniref:Extracellular solute-binding protein n=1 Tax=Paenibacillus agricola TaxID=2716264 RepID=A0ABX0JHS3_9BACL|nr:ABC transporter substrate-binding protein [Paenibacillus agricola]NHN35391.1 extracellular solute-binding protein [Paenibacillus agricola]